MADYRALLRSYLETTSDTVTFKDRDGRYLALSRSFYLAFGYERAEDLLGETDEAVLEPAEAAARLADDREVAATGMSLGPVEETGLVRGRPLRGSWAEGAEE